MSGIMAAIAGASIGLAGVLLGAWLNGRREHRHWLRDQKLHGAIEFITATGQLYAGLRHPKSQDVTPERRAVLYDRMQSGRSELYLLCRKATVDRAEDLVERVNRTAQDSDGQHHAGTIGALREMVQELREELGSGRYSI
jgi:hypothetical protein